MVVQHAQAAGVKGGQPRAPRRRREPIPSVQEQRLDTRDESVNPFRNIFFDICLGTGNVRAATKLFVH
jgi:hypothetical protein